MPCTIRTALTYYLDINANLKIRQFEVIIYNLLIYNIIDNNYLKYIFNFIFINKK